MRKAIGITFGIMTAFGGFLDLGQIVFSAQAGALFGYSLMWAIAIGTIGIILYLEMCGRIAVVIREPVFSIVCTEFGPKLGLATLVAANLLNVITCAAELGGVAIGLHLLTGWPERLMLICAVLGLGTIVFFSRFKTIERTFGLAGLLMLVFGLSPFVLHPDWARVLKGVIGGAMNPNPKQTLLYWYFAIGIFSALFMAYEVHFYSSGAIEEDWKRKELGQNVLVASVGSILGALLTAALLMLGAIVLLPRHIFPELLGTAIWAGSFPFGKKALVVAICGTLACIGGAAIETTLSCAYNVCQFFNLPWGKNRPVSEVRTFTALWMATLTIAFLIAVTGVRPFVLVDISIVFGMAIMPFTYYPILRIAGDRKLMGTYASGKLKRITGAVFLALITAAAIAAIPLMIVTHSGRP